MSLKNTVREVYPLYVVTVDDQAVQHGELGTRVTLALETVKHEFFFANDRKITETHALLIIRSYLK